MSSRFDADARHAGKKIVEASFTALPKGIGTTMKSFYSICAMLCASLLWATATPALAQNQASVKGQVLEVVDVESYSYLRLKTKDGETWAAVAKAPVKKGAEVTIENAMIMNNFESKSLKRTFQK